MSTVYIIGNNIDCRLIDAKKLEGQDVICAGTSIEKFPKAKYFVSMDYLESRKTLEKDSLANSKSLSKIFVVNLCSERINFYGGGVKDVGIHTSYDLRKFNAVIYSRNNSVCSDSFANFAHGNSSNFCAYQLAILLGFNQIHLLMNIQKGNKVFHTSKFYEKQIRMWQEAIVFANRKRIRTSSLVKETALNLSIKYLKSTIYNEANLSQLPQFKKNKSLFKSSYVQSDDKKHFSSPNNPPEIWTCIDNKIEKHFWPLFNSVKENTPNAKFNILCDKSVSNNVISQCRLRGIKVFPGVELNDINFSVLGRITKTMYYRWLIPEYSENNKAIYIDVDALAVADLNELWNLDISNFIIAAAPDLYNRSVYDGWRTHCKDPKSVPHLTFKNMPMYLSGQLLINCLKWKQNQITYKLISCANKYRTFDMIPLNIVCQNQILKLEKEWSVPGYNYFDEGVPTGNRSESMLDKSPYKNPKIIHWNGPSKPWSPNKVDISTGHPKIFHLEEYRKYNSTDKYVLLGSAPHAKQYWQEKREHYLKSRYKLMAINNAWNIDPESLTEWFHPDDFIKYGSIQMTPEDSRKFISTLMPRGRIYGYLDPDMSKSTMLLNVLYIMWNRYLSSEKNLEVVIIGNDCQFDSEETHFYKTDKLNPVVQSRLKNYCPHLVGKNADPLRFGIDWLKSELDNVQKLYDEQSFKIYVDTPLEKTLMPFKRVKL